MHTLNDISYMKTCLTDAFQHELCCKGYEGMDTEEAGQVVDMIKDLAQTEKDCWEACYYKSVVEAMDEFDFDGEFDIEATGRMGYGPRGEYPSHESRRMGYDTRRYASGRYAPKGRGHYSPVHGYTPNAPATHIPPYMMDNSAPYEYDHRMGYPHGGGEYGRSMDNYKMSKRYYTETHDPSSREQMDHHAKEHVKETVDSFKEIWGDASPETKKEMKGQLSKLLAEMQI